MTLWIGFDPTQCACAHDMSDQLIKGNTQKATTSEGFDSFVPQTFEVLTYFSVYFQHIFYINNNNNKKITICDNNIYLFITEIIRFKRAQCNSESNTRHTHHN